MEFIRCLKNLIPIDDGLGLGVRKGNNPLGMLFGNKDERFIVMMFAILFVRLFAVLFVKLSDNMHVVLLRQSSGRRNVRHPIATIFQGAMGCLTFRAPNTDGSVGGHIGAFVGR